LEYTKIRNAARAEVRKAVREYEKEIAKSAKYNPKMFYKHVNNKLKNRVAGSVLHNNDGNQINDNKQKAELLNEFFSSIYTIEDTQNISESQNMDAEHQLHNIHIEEGRWQPYYKSYRLTNLLAMMAYIQKFQGVRQLGFTKLPVRFAILIYR